MSPSPASLQICFNELEKAGQRAAGTQVDVLDRCHGPKEAHTHTHTRSDVIFPSIFFPPPIIPSSLFFSFLSSLPSAISLDWIAPWPQAQVAMWRCILLLLLLPPPTPLPLYLFQWSGSGLIDVRQPYITVQPSLSSWWLQSCHTARSIRVTPTPHPAVHTDHCLRKWKHTCKSPTRPCLERQRQDRGPSFTSRSQKGIESIVLEVRDFETLLRRLPPVCPTKQTFIFYMFWSATTVALFSVIVHFSVTISTSFLRHIVHESIYFMSFLMSVLKMIIMFLNCNGLPQKRLYFKRRVSHNIKQNLSIFCTVVFFSIYTWC